MLDLWKQTTLGQFEAALATMKACIDGCPDASWNEPVANMKFCQVVFHAVFYADCYLSQHTEAFLAQDFHKQRPEFFRDYEEMEDRAQVLLYERPPILEYVEHCRQKAAAEINAETETTLAAPCGFDWLGIPRAELHVYNLRHLQHHAAQLILRLRLDHAIDTPWSRTGWRE